MKSSLRALLVMGLAWLPASVLAQAVATPDTLPDVLRQVQRTGGTVRLAAGTYPDMKDSFKFSKPVTVDASGATAIGAWYWSGVQNLTIKGGRFTGRLQLPGAKHVTVTGGTFDHTGVKVVHGKDVRLMNLTFVEPGTAMSFAMMDGLLVEDVSIRDLAENGILCIGCNNVVVRKNTIVGNGPLKPGVHPDAIQFATFKGAPSSNIVVSDNEISGHMQGIFFGDPTGGYYKITIANNSVSVDFPNGIYTQNAQLTLGNNRLQPLPGGVRGASIKIIRPISTDDLGGNVVNGKRKDLAFRGDPNAQPPSEDEVKARAQARAKAKAEARAAAGAEADH